jgi:hypothetical protein
VGASVVLVSAAAVTLVLGASVSDDRSGADEAVSSPARSVDPAETSVGTVNATAAPIDRLAMARRRWRRGRSTGAPVRLARRVRVDAVTV